MPSFIINVKEKGAKKAEKNIKGLNNALGGLASKAALAAGGFFGAGMLLSGMKKAVDLAGQQEAAENALSTALGGNTRALTEQASALQKVSTFGDEAIIQQQAFLASLKFSENQIKDIIPVAMDLAAATGMTLESAVRNTAKTFSGLAGELGELVPQLRGLTKEQMMAGDAVKVMGDLFGGQASAQTETMQGKLEQLGNTLGDTAEAFGELLFPLVMPLASGLKLIGESAVSVMNAFKGMITEEEVNLLSEADLKIQDFQARLAQMSSVELINSAKGFSAMYENMTIAANLTKEEQANLQLLNEAIMNNTEIQDAMNLKITERNVLHEGVTIPQLKKIAKAEKTIAEAIAEAEAEKEKATIADLKRTALQATSAEGAMKGVVKAESMEAVAGLIASIFKSVPFPFNTILAAGAGGLASTIIDKNLKSFATGGSLVTSGEQLIKVGDNQGGRELVEVTPLSGGESAPNQSGRSIVVNVSGNVMSDRFVETELAEKIRDGVRRGVNFGF